jgi:hypothetical protein
MTILNGPMLGRLRQCAADTSSNWAGKMISIYPPEARGLVELVDAVASLVDCANLLDPAERATVFRASGCGWCGADHLAALPGARARR